MISSEKPFARSNHPSQTTTMDSPAGSNIKGLGKQRQLGHSSLTKAQLKALTGSEVGSESESESGSRASKRYQPIAEAALNADDIIIVLSDVATKVDLWQYVKIALPPAPSYFERTSMTGFKGLNKAEREFHQRYPRSVLKHIIYAPKLLDTVVRKIREKLEGFSIASTEPFFSEQPSDLLAAISPEVTTRKLTPQLRSEKDTEKWVYDVVLRPCLNILPYLAPSTNTKPEDLVHLKCGRSHIIHPDVTVSSSGGGDIIPDFLLNAAGKIRAVVEVKPEDPAEDKLAHAQRIAKSFEPLQHNHPNFMAPNDKPQSTHNPIRPVRFVWPNALDDFGGNADDEEPKDTQSRLIIQVSQWSGVDSNR